MEKVINGDVTQIDLPSGTKSGLKESIRILKNIDDSVTLEWYNERGIGVDSVELEITTYDHITEASTVCLNIATYEGY